MGNFVSRAVDRFTGRSGSRAAREAADQQVAALGGAQGILQQDFERQQGELVPLREFGEDQFGVAQRLQELGFDQDQIGQVLQQFGQGEQQFGQDFRGQGIGRQDIGFNQLDELQGRATPEGFAESFQALQNNPAFAPLIQQRQQDIGRQFKALGLGRSSDLVREQANLPLEFFADLESSLFNRGQNLGQFNVGAGGQNVDRAGNIINAGTSQIGTGTDVTGTGANIVTSGANVGGLGADIFSAGTPQFDALSSAGFEREKGIARAGGTLGSERAKGVGAQNIFGVAKKLPVIGGLF